MDNLSKKEVMDIYRAKIETYEKEVDALKAKYIKEGYSEFDAEESASVDVSYRAENFGFEMTYQNGKVTAVLLDKEYDKNDKSKFKPADDDIVKNKIKDYLSSDRAILTANEFWKNRYNSKNAILDEGHNNNREYVISKENSKEAERQRTRFNLGENKNIEYASNDENHGENYEVNLLSYDTETDPEKNINKYVS